MHTGRSGLCKRFGMLSARAACWLLQRRGKEIHTVYQYYGKSCLEYNSANFYKLFYSAPISLILHTCHLKMSVQIVVTKFWD